MKAPSHQSAKPSHYNEEAEHYDSFNEKTSAVINGVLEKILKQHNAKTVLDLTCGTGSQVFWLTKCGFDVAGSDINKKMLQVAKSKAKKEKLSLRFLLGDMRTIQVGKFDAVITIFNAIGHLTKIDFERAILNIRDNLHDGGLYIFDIFNLDFLLKDNQITSLTIDWQENKGHTKNRVIQYSTINQEGILASYTTLIEQTDTLFPKISKSQQTLQIYSAQQLKDMLRKLGFKVLNQYAVDGSTFIKDKSDRILTIAQKQSNYR